MNQMSPFGREPVELSLEAPFRLAQLDVTPAALELRRNGETWTIEHRVMKVLVALHRSCGHAVSRDDLIDLCWEGRIVGEDSLNRGISQLRKALAAEPAVTIDTIARIGYRLRIDKEDESPAASTSPRPRRLRRNAIIAGLAIFAAGSSALWWFSAVPGDWRAADLRPLTRDTGAETHPALSPDGQRIAYAAGRGFGAPRDILLRGTQLGDDVPVRITQTPDDDEFAPVWSPSGDRIAFIRVDSDGRCSLVVTTPPGGAERAVGRCGSSPSGLAWLGESELVFGDRAADPEPRRLIAMDIISGRTRPITTPPAGIVGDGAPVASLDNRSIAFRRTAALGSDDLYILDLSSGAERRLTRHGWKASGFGWGDNGTLFFTGNRGGDFGLWSIDTHRSDIPRRISLGTVPFGRISVDRSGRRLALEAERRHIQLVAIAPDGTMRPLTTDNGNDLDPDIAANGAIAFASDRGGTNELWVRDPGGRLIRLTRMGASFVYSPRWSPDGRQIAFLAVVDGRTDIYTIRSDGSRLTRVTEDGARKGRVAWQARSGGLLYTVRRMDAWIVLRNASGGGQPAAVAGTEGIAVIEGRGGRLFGRMAGAQTLVPLDPDSGSPLPGRGASQGLEGWAIGDEGLVELRPGRGGTPATLWLLPRESAPRQIAALHVPDRANPAIGPNGEIIIPQAIEDESDLMLITLER